MRTKFLMILCAGSLLVAGCSSSTHDLTTACQSVRFTDTQPGSECRLLGELTGTQSNWFSGQNGENSAMRGAANDLRNRAAAMGGNVIYGATNPVSNPVSKKETYLASFVPLDSKIQRSGLYLPVMPGGNPKSRLPESVHHRQASGHGAPPDLPRARARYLAYPALWCIIRCAINAVSVAAIPDPAVSCCVRRRFPAPAAAPDSLRLSPAVAA